VGGLGPRDPEEIVGPRPLSDVVVRPLNFTVRRHLGQHRASREAAMRLCFSKRFMLNGPTRLLAIVALCGPAHLASATPLDKVAGTYELLICKSACSFADPQNAFTRATVVLLDHTLPREERDLIDPYYHGSGVAKGCFSLKHLAKAESFAQIKTTGATPWQFKDGTLRFELYRSPDAGYFVELERRRGVLLGKGVSFGAGVANPGYSDDVVVGRRLKGADTSVCKPSKETHAGS
jgi:hypothetical protein